jgi:hypothetical protein
MEKRQVFLVQVGREEVDVALLHNGLLCLRLVFKQDKPQLVGQQRLNPKFRV